MHPAAAAERPTRQRALALSALLAAVALVASVADGARFVVIGYGSPPVAPWTAPLAQRDRGACVSAPSANLSAALRQALNRTPAAAAEGAGPAAADAGAPPGPEWLSGPRAADAGDAIAAPGCAPTRN